jgi:glutamate-ammonia-ligase adenylyltransferase
MTAGSDLDLIVIYDHDSDSAASDGKRPLAPSQYFTRLTQRLVASLSAPTAEGVAYAVDLRLRPSGRSGPLATHFEAFRHYQLNEAWTWEHMAMSRGRAIAGDATLMRQVDAMLDEIVAKPRDIGTLAGEVATMRARIEREKAAANAFDVKLAPGGLIDCEFAAQFLVLSGLGRVAGETTGAALARAMMEGKIAPAEGERLALSADLQSALLHVERVAESRTFDPEHAPDALKQLFVAIADNTLRSDGIGPERAGVASFAELQQRLTEIQTQSRAALETLLGVPVALPPSGG